MFAATFFLRAAALISLSVGLSRRGRASTIVVVQVPAAQMLDRGTFRDDFLANHWRTRAPYPVFSALYRGSLLPDDLAAAKQLGGCGELVFDGNQLRFSRSNAAAIVLPLMKEVNAGSTLQ